MGDCCPHVPPIRHFGSAHRGAHLVPYAFGLVVGAAAQRRSRCTLGRVMFYFAGADGHVLRCKNFARRALTPGYASLVAVRFLRRDSQTARSISAAARHWLGRITSCQQTEACFVDRKNELSGASQVQPWPGVPYGNLVDRTDTRLGAAAYCYWWGRPSASLTSVLMPRLRSAKWPGQGARGHAR